MTCFIWSFLALWNRCSPIILFIMFHIDMHRDSNAKKTLGNLQVYYVDTETQAVLWEFSSLPKLSCSRILFTTWSFKSLRALQVSTWDSPLIPCLQRVLDVGRRYLESPSEEWLEIGPKSLATDGRPNFKPDSSWLRDFQISGALWGCEVGAMESTQGPES